MTKYTAGNGERTTADGGVGGVAATSSRSSYHLVLAGYRPCQVVQRGGV